MRVSSGPRPWSQSCRLASVSTIMPKRGRGGRRERYCRGRRFCGEASFAARKMRAYGLAADGEVFLDPKFFREMGIVEALILAAGQAQDQPLRGKRKGPGHGASAVAVLYPSDGIGPIAAFEALHLAFTQLQQAGGFAYAQPPARCILDHFHPLELFLTHGHHPYRVTKSRCSYGVTLSWSNY